MCACACWWKGTVKCRSRDWCPRQRWLDAAACGCSLGSDRELWDLGAEFCQLQSNRLCRTYMPAYHFCARPLVQVYFHFSFSECAVSKFGWVRLCLLKEGRRLYLDFHSLDGNIKALKNSCVLDCVSGVRWERGNKAGGWFFWDSVNDSSVFQCCDTVGWVTGRAFVL